MLNIFFGAHCAVFNDTNQLYICPREIDLQIQLISTPKVEVVHEKKFTLKILSSSSLEEVDAPC